MPYKSLQKKFLLTKWLLFDFVLASLNNTLEELHDFSEPQIFMHLERWRQSFLPAKITVYGGGSKTLVYRSSTGIELGTLDPTSTVSDLRKHGWCLRICLFKMKVMLMSLVWKPVWEPLGLLYQQYLFYKTHVCH